MKSSFELWKLVLAGIVCLATVMGGSQVFADDAAPKPDPDKPAADSKEETKDAKSGEPSLLDKLSKELLKELDQNAEQKPAAAQKDDKLDRAAKGMRSAGERLEERQTDEETRKIQEQVIRDLDDLIKQLQNPPPNGGGGGGGGGSSGQIGQAQRPQKLSGGKPQGGKPKSQEMSGGGQTGGQEKKVAEGSDERTESERKAAEEAARKRKLELDVWGHLPPHLREQLLNTYGERMLPKYENLVKQFYEALSEQKDSSPRR